MDKPPSAATWDDVPHVLRPAFKALIDRAAALKAQQEAKRKAS